MLHDPRPPVAPDALPFARSSDAQEALLPRQFHLGQPHLSAAGLSLAWLIEECGHRHRWSIAESLRTRPSLIRDIAGRPVLTPVTTARIAGFTHSFGADEEVVLAFTLEPSAETGWRSEHALVGAGGNALSVELITAFTPARSDDMPALGQSQMPPHLEPEREGSLARRTRVLRARGRAAEAVAATHTADQSVAPSLAVPALGGLLHDGAALLCLAALARLFQAAEAAAGRDAGAPISARELHLRGGMALDDAVTVTLTHGLPETAGGGRTGQLATARRRTDDAIVALSAITRDV
ncbi:MAG: hypothetical protein AAFP17_05295 [Pseudomonadota bacterium]